MASSENPHAWSWIPAAVIALLVLIAVLVAWPRSEPIPPHIRAWGLAHSSFKEKPSWILDMHHWTDAKGPRSQGAQDYYFDKIFSVIGTKNRFHVEYGFNEASYDSGGSGANTRLLYEQGWRGLLLDAQHNNTLINLHAHYLYSSNIVSLFKKYNVPVDLDLLSSDMDSHDLWVLDAILKGGYRPRVIATEYNANYHYADTITLLEPSPSASNVFKFRGCAWGASAGALKIVADTYGYTLVGRVSYMDLIWLRNDLVEPWFVVPSYDWFFRKSRVGEVSLHPVQNDKEIFDHLIDYEVYRSTHDLDKSKEAALHTLYNRNLTCFVHVISSRMRA